MVVPTTLAVRTRAGEFVFTSFGVSAVGDTRDIASVIVLVPLYQAPCGLAGTGTYASSVEIALNGVIALTQFSQIWNAASAIKFKIALFFDHISVFARLLWCSWRCFDDVKAGLEGENDAQCCVAKFLDLVRFIHELWISLNLNGLRLAC
jgi:hypothetical protein